MTFLARVLREARELGGFRERDQTRARARRKLHPHIRALRHQWFGTGTAGCSATHSVHEACDFGCTACYLGHDANRTTPAPFADIEAQLSTIREHLGPAGNVQITSGEVTLLPREQLSRIVRRALELGLDPMVMSHGQTFLRDPSYLEYLVDHGLSKVALHVDSTQRGRDGHRKPQSERELHSVRNALAMLVRDVRARTGKTLHAAHTMTVTDSNLDEVPSVVRWTMANADVFRMLSLQPASDAGRTRARRSRGELVWERVRQATGRPLSEHTFVMGHPACNRLCLAFVVQFDDRVEVLEVAREGASIDAAFVDHLVRGPFRHLYLDGASPAETMGRLLGVFARNPAYLLTFPVYSLYRMAAELEWLPAFINAATRGRASVRPMVFVVHDFLSRDELDTPLGRARTDACVFRVPVDGKMVSMCTVNATGLRDELNRAMIPASRLVR